MVFDDDLAERVREAVGRRAQFSEQKMFGGLAFMVNTHMACGITRDILMIHVGTAGYEQALADGAEPVQMGERTMGGMVRVDPDGDPGTLQSWVDRGVDLALSELPKKPPTKPRS